MAEAMLYAIKKDQGRPSCAKRQMSRSGLEKTPPLVRDPVMSQLSGMSEDPAERVLSPRATTRRSVRTSSPADSGNDSEGELLPSYEVMMREAFSPISPASLELPILPDLDEEETLTMREDVKPIAEVKAAPPAEAPVATTTRDCWVSTARRCTTSRRQTYISICRMPPWDQPWPPGQR